MVEKCAYLDCDEPVVGHWIVETHLSTKAPTPADRTSTPLCRKHLFPKPSGFVDEFERQLQQSLEMKTVTYHPAQSMIEKQIVLDKIDEISTFWDAQDTEIDPWVAHHALNELKTWLHYVDVEEGWG